MLGEGLDAAETAFRVGYESPSQFSREYRRMFGTPPRQNVAPLKVEALSANQRGLARAGPLDRRVETHLH